LKRRKTVQFWFPNLWLLELQAQPVGGLQAEPIGDDLKKVLPPSLRFVVTSWRDESARMRLMAGGDLKNFISRIGADSFG